MKKKYIVLFFILLTIHFILPRIMKADPFVFLSSDGTEVASYTEEEILKWMRKCYWRFFSQQFKRSCLPDGPKVGSVSVSPRGDLRMPSDANVRIWMDEIEKLN